MFHTPFSSSSSSSLVRNCLVLTLRPSSDFWEEGEKEEGPNQCQQRQATFPWCSFRSAVFSCFLGFFFNRLLTLPHFTKNSPISSPPLLVWCYRVEGGRQSETREAFLKESRKLLTRRSRFKGPLRSQTQRRRLSSLEGETKYHLRENLFSLWYASSCSDAPRPLHAPT